MAEKSAQQVAEAIRALVSSPTVPQEVKSQLAALLTNGTYPTNPMALSLLQDVTSGSKYAAAPGTLYSDLIAWAGPSTPQTGIAEQVAENRQAGPPAPVTAGPPAPATTTPTATATGNPLAQPGAATTAFARAAGAIPAAGGAAGAGYVDEFGGMLTGPGAGQSQRPTEAGIASQVAREQARKAAAQKPTITLPTGKAAAETQKGAAPVSATTSNQGGGFLSEVERALAAQDPNYAIAAIRQAKTGGKRDMSAAGGFREGMLGSALRAFLAMQMPNSDGSFVGDPVGAANQGLADIVAGSTGGGFGGVLRGQAANLMGQDFSGMQDDQIYKMLAAASDAAGFGYGDFAQYGPQNALAEADNAMRNNVMSGGTTAVLAQPGALQTFQKLLQQYLGAQ